MTLSAGINLLAPPASIRNRQKDPDARLSEIYSYLETFHRAVGSKVLEYDAILVAIAEVTLLTQAITDPPTQAEVQAVQAKINEIISAAGTSI